MHCILPPFKWSKNPATQKPLLKDGVHGEIQGQQHWKWELPAA